jgi:dihydrofolate reductase
MPQRSPERLPSSPSKKPRSAPRERKKPSRTAKRVLLTVGALGTLAGGVVLGKRTWESLNDMQQMKVAKKIVDMKIPVVSPRVDAVLQRRVKEKTIAAVKDFQEGMMRTIDSLGKMIGIGKKKQAGGGM